MRSPEKGFSLIEVIVALSILAVVALAFVPLLASSFKLVYEAGHRSDATYQAHSRMEHELAGKLAGDSFNMQMVFTNKGDGTQVPVVIQGYKVEIKQTWGFDNDREISYYTFYPY